MEATIDKFGRLVIPKKVREHWGLHPGSVLKIEERNHDIRLRPIETEPVLQKEEGVLVFTGTLQGVDTDILKDIREERLKRIIS